MIGVNQVTTAGRVFAQRPQNSNDFFQLLSRIGPIDRAVRVHRILRIVFQVHIALLG